MLVDLPLLRDGYLDAEGSAEDGFEGVGVGSVEDEYVAPLEVGDVLSLVVDELGCGLFVYFSELEPAGLDVEVGVHLPVSSLFVGAHGVDLFPGVGQ